METFFCLLITCEDIQVLVWLFEIKSIFKDDKYNLNVKNTILNPQIKKNKYIIIPDDNASNLKKLYLYTRPLKLCML